MAMMMLLQARRSLTAASAAAELEVSIRTIYRDVAALQEAGVPLWTESGPGGGIRLLEGWRTRLDGLTGDEAAALSMAGAPAAIADLGWGSILLTAQSKLASTLPAELQARAGRVRERFLLDAPGWFGAEATPACLDTVADAVWSGRRLDIEYQRGTRCVRRRLDPLGLVCKAGVWYLVASHRGQPRTYRVGRIARARRRDQPAHRPPAFVLSAWWEESAREFDQSLLRKPARLRLAPWALRALHEVVGQESASGARETATAPDDDGWCVVDIRLEAIDVGTRQLSGLAGGVEVLDPPALRAGLRELADYARTLNN